MKCIMLYRIAYWKREACFTGTAVFGIATSDIHRMILTAHSQGEYILGGSWITEHEEYSNSMHLLFKHHN